MKVAVKGIIHTKRKSKSSFAHLGVVRMPFFLSFFNHKRRIFYKNVPLTLVRTMAVNSYYALSSFKKKDAKISQKYLV